MLSELSTILERAAVEPTCDLVRVAEKVEDLPEHARWAAEDHDVLPALVFTWRTLEGEEYEQVRPYRPVEKKTGEMSKYLWPKGVGSVLSVPVRRPDAQTVVIVEGTKQHLAALRYAPEDWQVVGIGGCSSWTTDGVADPALATLALGKDVVILFDADWATNRAVYDAAAALGTSCKSFGASSVRWARIPGRGSTGLDDLLGSLPEVNRADVLARIVEAAGPKLGQKPAASKTDSGNKFWGEKSPLVEKIAEDLLLNGSWALDKQEKICVYEGGMFNRWSPAVTYEVVERLGDMFKKSYVSDVEAVLATKLSKAGLYLPDRQSEPLLNLVNTMLDLDTMTEKSHSASFLSSQQLPVSYDPDATCPTYEEWVHKMTEDVDDLEEAVSLMLDPTRTPSKAVFLYGPSRSGKSTMLRLVTAIAGPRNVSAVTLQSLADNRFAAANLYGKVLNVAADLSAKHLQDTSTFKMLTGEDMIQAERKYGQPFEFTNIALMAFSANQPPAVAEASNAYLERIKPFRFPHSFAGAEDPSIEAKMMEELPGILNRLLAAYARFRARGWYAPTMASVEADFAQHADRVRAWIASSCRVVTRPNGTSAKELHGRYSTWSEHNNYGKLGYQTFIDKLRNIGIEEFGRHGTSAVHFRLEVVDGENPPDDLTFDPDPRNSSFSSVSEDTLIIETKAQKIVTTPHSVTTEKRGRAETDENDEFEPDAVVAVDFETPAADCLYAGDYEGEFCRLMVWDDGSGPRSTTDQSVMRRVLEHAPHLATHSGWRFDLPAAAFHLGLDVEKLIAKADDLFVASRLSRPPREARGARPLDHYGLDDLASTHLGEQKTPGLAKLKRKYKGYDKIPTDHPEYVEYALQDARLTRRLHDVAAPHFTEPYYQRERRIAAIAAAMSVRGLAVDHDLLATRLAEQAEHNTRIRTRLAELGFPDSASPGATDAGRALVGELAGDLPVKRTPTGKVSTARDDLLGMNIPEGHPLREPADLLVELSTERPFLGAVAAAVAKDGRIHPEYSITGVNGRWSSARPNIMGVGKRSEALLADRDLIVAAPGHVFVQADLKGIDNRSIAGLSGDAAYAELLAPGVEINAELAKMFYGGDVDYKAVKPKIKAIGHGINFGRMPKAIAEDNGLDIEEVTQIWQRYFTEFPLLAQWQRDMRTMAKAGAALPNGHGRFVRCYPRNEHTQAPALPTASCTRDLAMTGLLRLNGWTNCIAMFIHDEVLLEVPESRAEEARDALVEAMSFEWKAPSGLTIPIIAEPATTWGPRWTDAYRED